MLKASSNGFDKPLFANLTRFIDLLPDVLEEEALELGVQLEDTLKEIYNDAPPRSSAKFVWSLDKAKNLKALRWWFWALSQGLIPTDGRHYIRQQSPPRGGKILISRDSERITVTITNTWAKAGLVYGQIDKDTRLPGHKQTGWELASPKIQAARRAYLEALFNRIQDRRREAGL